MPAEIMKELTDFNSHAHVERDVICKHVLKIFKDFNSHAHVERDIFRYVYAVMFCISTHTLTWSVTKLFIHRRKAVDISTHTLTWSVTYYCPSSSVSSKFQLTRSRGA